MKAEFLFKRYILKILSPVHVGYGDVYEPTSFVVDTNRKELLVLDMDKFLLSLSGKEIEEFSNICKYGNIYSIVKLYQFMASKVKFVKSNSSLIVRKIKVSSSFVEHFEKVKNISYEELRNKKKDINSFNIFSFAYSPNQNLPIIPGSSLKGAIRTAILNKYQRRVGGGRFRKAKELEKLILDYKKPNNDIMKRIKVSDFVPRGNVATRIVYGVNIKKNGGTGSGPYQIFEVVEKGAEFEGSIEIVRGLDEQPSIELSFEFIEKALQDFYQQRFEEEEKVIERLQSDLGLPCLGIPLKIGRHSGAEAVTIENFRRIKINRGRGNKPIYKKEATTMWFVSDSPRVLSLSSLLPFARACILPIKDNKSISTTDKEVPTSFNNKKEALDFSKLKSRFKVN
jgi:CRISPR-associated protein Csm5